MPGMDGFELCRRVKRIADLPIIVLSAVDASEAKVRALEQYAEDYVTKPFDPDELVARIQRVLRRASSGRAPDHPGRRRRGDRPGARRAVDAGRHHQLTPTEVRLLQVLASLGRPDRAQPRRAARPRLDGCGRRRSLVCLGHHATTASQARGGPGPSALPADRARHRLPPRLRLGHRIPAGRRPCPAPGSGCASSSRSCWPSCRRSCSSSRRIGSRRASLALAERLGRGGRRMRRRSRGGRQCSAARLSPAASPTRSRSLAGTRRARGGPATPQHRRRVRQMAISLDERNRQIAALAGGERVPIDDEPRRGRRLPSCPQCER